MYHSITFGDKNTWDDWKIVPKERPYFEPPAVKTNYVDIPGASSKLDFSEALTGYPLYENRTGSIEFYILNALDDVNRHWQFIYSEIQNHLHNKKMRAILEDDPLFYYEGRFAVDSYQPGNSAEEPRSTITISYDVGPYKWSTGTSIQTDWLWDPFDFENDVIQSGFFSGIEVDTSYKTIDFNERAFVGYAPFTPELIISTTGGGMDFEFKNPDLSIDKTGVNGFHLDDGTYKVNDIVIYGLNSYLKFKTTTGTGRLSISFREGRL